VSGIEDEVVAGDLNTPAHQDDDLHKERHKGWLWTILASGNVPN
jgi:hypothetical protein